MTICLSFACNFIMRWKNKQNRLTTATIGSEAICSWCTLVTASSNHIGFTTTLTSDLITLSTEGALGVTLTGCIQEKQIKDDKQKLRKWGWHNDYITSEFCCVFVFLLTQSTVMNDARNATDEFGAHLSQGRHRRDHKRIETYVANHFFSSVFCLRRVTLETRKLCVLGDQHQLLRKSVKIKL